MEKKREFMKKMILTALVAVASLAANAQVWVGGEVGFSATKTSIDGNKKGAAARFNLLPEIGYSINDKFDIALTIGLSHANANGDYFEGSKNFDTFGGIYDDVNRNAFTINPYVRYKFANAGDFTFFVDGGFSYTMIHYSGADDNGNQWAIGFKPGIAYSLTDKVSLVAHVGDLGYSFYKCGDTKSNAFDMGISNNISFGAYVSF